MAYNFILEPSLDLINIMIIFLNFFNDNIYELLTLIALAHLIMGDGAKWNKSIVLCTDSFLFEK